MKEELKALDYQILDALWNETGGMQRYIHVDRVSRNIKSQYDSTLTPSSFASSLEQLDKFKYIETKRKRVGIYQIRITDIGQTKLHENKTGIPQFFTRNIHNLKENELEDFEKELQQRLAASEVNSRDFNLTKEKINEILILKMI